MSQVWSAISSCLICGLVLFFCLPAALVTTLNILIGLFGFVEIRFERTMILILFIFYLLFRPRYSFFLFDYLGLCSLIEAVKDIHISWLSANIVVNLPLLCMSMSGQGRLKGALCQLRTKSASFLQEQELFFLLSLGLLLSKFLLLDLTTT